MLPDSPPQPTLATEDSPGALAAVGAVLLAGALVFGVLWAWSQPSSVGSYNLREAETLLSENRYTEASALLEGTLRYYPSSDTRLLLSEAYLGLRDAGRAERQARTALSVSRPHERAAAWVQIGRAHAQNGAWPLALDAWEQARIVGKPYSDDPQVAHYVRASLWRTASHAWQKGDTDTSLTYLQALADGADSYTENARLHLAQYYAPTNAHLSLEYLSNPGKDAAFSTRFRVPTSDRLLPDAEVKRLSQALRDAHSEAEKVSRERPGDKSAQAALWGTAYLQQGEYTLARRQLEQAVQLDPNAAGAYTRLAIALAALGDIEGALRRLERARSLSPDDPLTRRVLAGIFMGRREWALADAELVALSTLQPLGVEPHLARAEYHSLRGEYDDAEREYEQAALIERSAQKGEGASLAAARFYIDTRGKICERGLPYAQSALQFEPQNPVALDLVGWALVICGDAVGGAEVLNRAVELAPDSPRYRYHLARAYAEQSRPQEALHQLTRVTDLDPGGPWSRLAASERVKIELRD